MARAGLVVMVSCLMLVGGCDNSVTAPDDYVWRAVGLLATLTSEANAPDVTPDNGKRCQNCGGTGKVGDGTVSVDCPVCGGDGIVDDEESPEPDGGQVTPAVDPVPDPGPEDASPDEESDADGESGMETDEGYYAAPRRWRLFRRRR